jgi:zinc protease
LEVFVDILRNPVFGQAKVDLAKSQMLEMNRRRNDSPPQIRGREFMRALYGKCIRWTHPSIETIMKDLP